jgi:zinc protease
LKPRAILPAFSLTVALLLALPAEAWPGTEVPRLNTLENGLKVVLLEDHSSPLVAQAVWVRVGGRDESQELSGFSHYLEHLVPMGTRGRAPRQQLMEIFRSGGLFSIQASYDRTFFFTEVGTADQDMALQSLFQMVSQATLTDEGAAWIKPTLLRELKEIYDDPAQVLFLEQMRTAFPGQPYRFPYHGSFTTLPTLESSSASAFYANFYVPNNMVVAVGGDINSAKTLSRIRALFGGLKASKTLPARPGFEPGFTGARNVVKNLPRMQPSVSVLFPTPGYRHPDRFALAVLARLLDDPAASPVVKHMMDPQRAALSVSSRFHLLEERGLLVFTVLPASAGSAVETGRQLLSVLKRVRDEGLAEADVARIVRQMRLETAVRRAPLGNLVQNLAEGVLFGDLRSAWDPEAGLAGVGAGDLKRVAATYLSAGNGKTLIILPRGERVPSQEERDSLARSATDLGPEAAPPDFSATLQAADRQPALQPRPETKAVPASRSLLPNGMVLLVKPVRGPGIVAASLQVRAGTAFDPEGKEGLAQMVASALPLGTKSIPGPEFRQRVAAIGSTFGITASRETVEAGLTVFPADLQEALTLLARPIQEPILPEDQMGAVRERILRFGEARAASAQETVRDLVREKIFRGHPYGRTSTGTEASLASVTRAEMEGFHRRHYRPDRAVLTLAGDVGIEEGRRLAAAAFGSWTAPADEKAPPDLPEAATREALSGEFSRVVNVPPAAVALGFPGVALRDPEFPLVRALAALLSARGTLDLVLSEPMAYAVNALPEGLSRGGILSVEASAPPSEASKVTYELLLQARTLGMKEVTPATVKDLVAIERGRLLREKEGIYTLASNLGFYELLGAGFSVYDEGKLLPPALTPALLKEGAARYLDAARSVRATAGPPPTR